MAAIWRLSSLSMRAFLLSQLLSTSTNWRLSSLGNRVFLSEQTSPHVRKLAFIKSWYARISPPPNLSTRAQTGVYRVLVSAYFSPSKPLRTSTNWRLSSPGMRVFLSLPTSPHEHKLAFIESWYPRISLRANLSTRAQTGVYQVLVSAHFSPSKPLHTSTNWRLSSLGIRTFLGLPTPMHEHKLAFIKP
jgi:hypothetical protein